MSFRRAALAVSALAWLGMMGALVYRERSRAPQGEAAAGYLESIFGENAPLFTSQAIMLQDATGPETNIGYIETEIQRLGPNDARVTTTVEVRAKDLPLQAAGAVKLAAGSVEDLHVEVDSIQKRYGGLQSITGYATWGADRWDFRARRRGEMLQLTTSCNGEDERTSALPYDPRLPFGGGFSPFAGVRNLKVGDSWEVTQLNPLNRAPMTTRITVDREETIAYKDKPEKCLVLGAHPAGPGGPGGPGGYGLATATAWVASDGRLLREETSFLVFKLALVLEGTVTAKEPDATKPRKRPRPPPPSGKGRSP